MSPPGALGLLKDSVRGHVDDLLLWALWSAVEAVPAFLAGRLVAAAVDQGFIARRPLAGLGYLAVLAAASLIGAWGTRQAYLRLAALVEPFRDELVRRSVQSSLRRAAGSAHLDSSAVARLTQQVEIVREAYASVLMVLQGFLITSTSALLGLLTLMPRVLWLVLVPMALAAGLFAAVLPRLALLQARSILVDERLAEAAGSVCAGLRDVVAAGAEPMLEASIGDELRAQADVTVALARLNAVRALAVGLGGLAPVLLILLRTPWLLRHGAPIGAVLGALTYVLEGVHPALQTFVRSVGAAGMWLSVTLRRIGEATASADIVEASSSAVSDARCTGVTVLAGPAGPATWAERDGAVPAAARLVGVRFAYGPDAEPVLRRLDLDVARGDRLVIVGPSGAGKSTLVNLIAGLLRPQEGSVRYGAEPVADLDPATLARRRVLIPQEAYVFAGTLRQNLLYLNGDPPPALLSQAVAALGATALVRRLGGLEAELSPRRLSDGERQMIALVRAYLSPASLVILDEATCHLDADAEARVEHAFDRRGGTVVLVAHRMSSALRARHVLVLDGRSALLDTPDGLLRRSALFRDLVGHWTGDHEPPSPAGVRARQLQTPLA